jgi:hypothetical protein
MTMNHKYLFRAIALLVLVVSFVPASSVSALPSLAVPPADFFQLPWDQGVAWVAIDGIDNGTKRPLTSSHHYSVGGAIDFAPRSNMVKGEDTSNFWTAAAGAGTVVGISTCHIIIDHRNGWITQYQFLANIQVQLGDQVARNQRLGIIADGVRNPFCPGSLEPNVPHLHFMLRPTIIGASFAGWTVNYLPVLNKTTFTKNGQAVGLFKPLLNVFDSTPTPSPTPSTTTPTVTETPSTPVATATLTPPSGPYVSTTVNLTNIQVGETARATVSLNNVPPNEYTSGEFTCAYDESLVEVSNIAVVELFGADAAVAINGPQNGSFIVAIAGSNGNKATTSGTVFTFDAKGLQAGQSALECTARVSKGDNVLSSLPSIGTSLTISDLAATPTATQVPTSVESATPTSVIVPSQTETPVPAESHTPTSTEQSSQTLTPDGPTTTPSPTETPTPGGGPIFTATPTSFANDWLTFTNLIYGFAFKYPPQGVIADGRTDGFARIDLPFVLGTNLREKYVEVIVQENVNPCQSPLQSQFSEMITINGISFLKQSGADAGVGHLHQWVAYSTLRDNICVSLDFILHSLNPDNFSTPPPEFDFTAESAVFEQIVSTYTWLTLSPTATPTIGETSVPVESPTPTVTSTPVESPTPIASPTSTSTSGAVLTGQVIASKVVTVRLFDLDENFVDVVNANPDGTFRFELDAGTYTIIATANGFLRAQGQITLIDGEEQAMPLLNLLAGDIDDNGDIDQFDAMTIGMNYNSAFPEAADLNSDGVINVLDLELLAQHYRATGPTPWE